MKDTAAFVVLAVSLFYYIAKYRIAYFTKQAHRLAIAEAILLLAAIGLFSFAALYLPDQSLALSSLVVVVFGLFFDAVRERYPGRGLIASVATVNFLLVDSVKQNNTPVIVVCSVYILFYLLLVSYKVFRSDKPVYTPVSDAPLFDSSSL